MYKLLSTLKRIEAENCVVLTYNLDLPFFESSLFEPLYGYGCRNTLVICDPRQYDIALEDASLLRYAGQRYLLFSGKTSTRGAFHPKLIMLTSKNRGYLYVLSGNLSRAGYTNNWEVLTEFAFDDREPDPIAWRAFRWAFESTRKIVAKSDSSGLANERLDRLWGTTPWLREVMSEVKNAPIWMLNNLSLPLLDQIESLYRQHDNHKIKKAIVISPYFDYEAQALEALLSRFQPKTLDVYTQSSPCINPKALNRVLKRQPAKFSINELTIPRRLHAKVLLLQTNETVWLASGSANFSEPALLHPSHQGNTELIVLRHESDTEYYKEWLDELIQGATEIDWKEIPPLQATPPPGFQTVRLRLEVARLNGLYLELKLAPTPAIGSILAINLSVGQNFRREYKIREILADGWVKITLPKELSANLAVPALVSVIETTVKGKTSQSNSVLLHNIPALERYSKPPHSPNRPKIPPGLTPENDAEYAWLLDMIQDLLITNQEQLKRYNPHIVADREDKSKEEEIEIEDEYDPKAHIVIERVRSVPRNSTSDDLYPDYDKRWTYQEILNAVLAATYSQKFNEAENGKEVPSKNNPDKNKKIDPNPHDPKVGNEEHLRIKNRISNGFRRLVRNFEQGLADEEYLASIPPNYLLELWLIITKYLQVVWKNDLLDKGTFYDLSLDMLFSFWGKPAQPGAWQTIKDHLSTSDLQTELQRLSLPLNTWLFGTLLFQLLEDDRENSRFELAGWMRKFTSQVASPNSLSNLDEGIYSRAWVACFPKQFPLLPLTNLIQTLNNVSQQYDDDSLKDEIQERTGYLPKIEYGKIANLLQVPMLTLRMPLTDSILNECFQVFQLFLSASSNRSAAWARFENINPVMAEEDIRLVTIIFRNDMKTFDFAAERLEKQIYRPDYNLSGITLEKLKRITKLSEIGELQ